MTDHHLSDAPGAESAPTAVRTARITWLTDPPHGNANLSVGSRAFAALPMAYTCSDDEPRMTDAGELMAAAHGSAVIAILAQILVREGTPAHELVVMPTFTFAGEWFQVARLDLYIEGRVPGSDSLRFEDAALEAVRRSADSFGAPEAPNLSVTARLL